MSGHCNSNTIRELRLGVHAARQARFALTLPTVLLHIPPTRTATAYYAAVCSVPICEGVRC